MKLSEEYISDALSSDVKMLEKSKELSQGIYLGIYKNVSFLTSTFFFFKFLYMFF